MISRVTVSLTPAVIKLTAVQIGLSALGQKQTCAVQLGMSTKGHKQTSSAALATKP
jgi:hypothetical protein